LKGSSVTLCSISAQYEEQAERLMSKAE
jgi:hypothetical protein